jgi:hypothetical protein
VTLQFALADVCQSAPRRKSTEEVVIKRVHRFGPRALQQGFRNDQSVNGSGTTTPGEVSTATEEPDEETPTESLES